MLWQGSLFAQSLTPALAEQHSFLDAGTACPVFLERCTDFVPFFTAKAAAYAAHSCGCGWQLVALHAGFAGAREQQILDNL
jgi:hypothetical protein